MICALNLLQSYRRGPSRFSALLAPAPKRCRLPTHTQVLITPRHLRLLASVRQTVVGFLRMLREHLPASATHRAMGSGR